MKQAFAFLTTLFATASLPACHFQPASPAVVWQPDSRSLGPKEASWTMIDVTKGPQQADAHLLDLSDGTRILIDTGNGGDKLVPYLASHGIRKLDVVLITHPHHDHYGGLQPAIEAGVTVGTVLMNLPDRGDCDRERPWGCKWEELQALFQFLKSKNIPVRTVTPGEEVHRSAIDSLDVLYAYSHDTNPNGPGPLDINDTSVICLLKHGKTRVLFTGDLNRPVGTYLALHGKQLEADLLKVPHHGTEGVAPNEFFDRVRPKFAFVPAPHDLWQSDRSKRIREYFAQKHIPVYVSGDEGDVTVLLRERDFKIASKLHSRRP